MIMKLLVQSDDYALTKAIVDSCCDAFEFGLLKNTGIFMNMPTTQYGLERIKQYPEVCLGIDINVSTGECLSDPQLIPDLVHEGTKRFVQVSERMKDTKFIDKCFRPYEQVMIEAKAQINKFIEMTGKTPEYIQTHSAAGEKEYVQALSDVAKEYGIKFRGDVVKQYGFVSLQEAAIGEKYADHFSKNMSAKEAQIELDIYSIENQMLNEVGPTLHFLEKLLEQKCEYVFLGTHCGWLSADLFKYSRCNINRVFDHELLTSEKLKKWIEDNNVELITYRDL